MSCHAPGGIEAKGATTRQGETVDPLHEMTGRAGVQLAGAGGAATHVASRHRPRLAENRRASRDRLAIGRMSNENPRNARESHDVVTLSGARTTRCRDTSHVKTPSIRL